MENFPQFMRRAANRIPAAQQNALNAEGYYYTAADGSRMTFWTCLADRTSEGHTHPFDEYLICVSCRYADDLRIRRAAGRVRRDAMIRHIVLFSFKDSYTPEQRAEYLQKIKYGLERLQGRIDGMISMEVVANTLATSNCDFMLDSVFESEAALAAYQTHPEHREISNFIGDVRKTRSCFDYEIARD